MDVADIVALNSQVNPSCTRNMDRGPIEAAREGKAVEVEGYLVDA